MERVRRDNDGVLRDGRIAEDWDNGDRWGIECI